MSHNYGKLLLISCISLSGANITLAQNSNRENAPYSRYGIGEQRNGVNVVLRGMGSISTGYASPFTVNTDNPASYASLKLTTYEAGGEGGQRNVISGASNFQTGMATLSYLNIGVPLGKNGGMVLGLKPHTRVYYNLQDSIIDQNIGPAIAKYTGDGGTNYAFIGGAYKYKGFSAGFNFGYLFGTTRYTSQLDRLYDTVKLNNVDFSRYNRVGGIYWKAGLMYEADVKKTLGIRFGATASLTQDVNVKQDRYYFSYRTLADTVIKEEGVEGKIDIPMSYSFGVQLFNREKWTAGVDFTSTQWGQFRSFGLSDSLADNTIKVAVGGEYTPSTDTRNGLFSRITYRLGGYYGTDHVRLRNTDMNYYAVTAGVSLPFRRSPDRIHLGFEIGRRGTESNGLFKENFYRFSAGISLNDKWFIKRRYD